jgi:hypothetical protein
MSRPFIVQGDTSNRGGPVQSAISGCTANEVASFVKRYRR